MIRLLTYFSITIIIVIVASCSNENNNNISESKGEKLYTNRSNGIVSIEQKNATSLVNQNPDTTFLYHTIVKTNIGNLVNLNLSELPSQTSDVPQGNTQYEINYINEPQLVEKGPVLLNIVFDNDIFNNTDYYYTNGVKIELTTPFAKQSPISRLLLGVSESQINLFGFSIMQNIYTPTNPDIEEISIGDRPFSAFLTIGQFRESYNLKKRLSIKSSINFGVIGPASLGGVVQSSIHDIEPVGWNNQIENNFVLDYSIKIEKGVISNPHAEFNLTAGGNVGTIFNKVAGGFYFRTGSFIPVFKGPSTVYGAVTSRSALQYWFFVTGETNLVLYDATLQGGLFSKENPYVIHGPDINRVVFNLSAGFAIYHKKIGMELQSFYLSPEFKNAYDFRWGRIKLVFQF